MFVMVILGKNVLCFYHGTTLYVTKNKMKWRLTSTVDRWPHEIHSVHFYRAPVMPIPVYWQGIPIHAEMQRSNSGPVKKIKKEIDKSTWMATKKWVTNHYQEQDIVRDNIVRCSGKKSVKEWMILFFYQFSILRWCWHQKVDNKSRYVTVSLRMDNHNVFIDSQHWGGAGTKRLIIKQGMWLFN